jgi:hypothetical protein
MQVQPHAPSSTKAEPAVAAEGQLEQVRTLLQSAQEPARKDSSDEEALEDYMGRFMERLVGKKPEASRAAETATIALKGAAAVSSLQQSPPAPAPVAAPREPSKPPECIDQLALLREVANQSARHAIAEHDRGHVARRVRYVWMASVGCSLFSSSLAAMSLLAGLRFGVELAVITSAIAWCLAGGFFLMYRQLPKRSPATGTLAG